MHFVMNHVGLTVADVERSKAFYRQFGAKVHADNAVYRGEEVDRGLGLEGVEVTVCQLSFGSTVVELHQYHSPQARPNTSRICDIGTGHLAFEVQDMQATYDDLVAAGIEVLTPPNPIAEGPFAGGAWMYARDPDGVLLELVQAGAGPSTHTGELAEVSC